MGKIKEWFVRKLGLHERIGDDKKSEITEEIVFCETSVNEEVCYDTGCATQETHIDGDRKNEERRKNKGNVG